MPALEITEQIYMMTGAIVSCLLLLVIIALSRVNRSLCEHLQYAQKHNEKLIDSIQMLTNRSDEFAAGYRQLQTDLALKELYKGASDEYLQAINAAKSGADAAEIADNFGMINSEAELIVSIHGDRKEVA